MEIAVKNQIRNDINRFCRTKDISKNEAAPLIGVSSATLSNIENENWALLADEMLIRIQNFINPGSLTLVKTANFNTVWDLCLSTQKRHNMSALVGYTGAGKTTALQEYFKNTRKVYLLTGKKSMRPKRFFAKLLRQMGVMYTGTIGDMIERIAEEFNRRPNSLLIIDEAGKLDQTMFMYLHDLRDETHTSTGILLAGVEYFKSNLEKAVQKQSQGMPEFFDRIVSWQNLKRPTWAEIDAICKVNGLNDHGKSKELRKVRNFRHLTNQISNVKIKINN
ncbi:MAG: ATP-binding protein [Bacteroidetes bacterium]|nr:ATP-binding protein [Bacteroidota bacterium]